MLEDTLVSKKLLPHKYLKNNGQSADEWEIKRDKKGQFIPEKVHIFMEILEKAENLRKS